MSAFVACRMTSRMPAIQTSAIDVNSLWPQLATLPAPDRDNLVAGLAPNARAGLARIADVAAAVAVIR